MTNNPAELKNCPIKEVYERFKHLDKLLCDPKIRKDYDGDKDPYKLTMFAMWDAIKEHQTRPPTVKPSITLEVALQVMQAYEELTKGFTNWGNEEERAQAIVNFLEGGAK